MLTPTKIEKAKRFILIVMESATGFPNGSDWDNRESLGGQGLQGLRALLSDFMD
jgi:two-component sensor histidine kinase